MQILEHLKIPVTRFTHLYETDSSYFVLGNNYYSVNDLGAKDTEAAPREDKLLEVYKMFDIKTPPRNESTGALLNPFGICLDILDAKVDLEEICRNDRSTAAFLSEELYRRNLDQNLLKLWAVLDLQRPFTGHSILEFILDSNQKEMEKAKQSHSHYVEIVNGSSVLPDRILEKLQTFEDFEYLMETEVSILKQDEKRGKVEVLMKTRKQKKSKIISDFSIIATTARAVRLMKFQPPLSYSKKTALASLFYFGSGMISILGETVNYYLGLCCIRGNRSFPRLKASLSENIPCVLPSILG